MIKAKGPKGLSPHWYIRLLFALYLATFLIRTSYGIITITFPDYTGITGNVSFGFLWAAGPLAEIFTVLFIGNLVDRYGRKWALLIGLVAGAVSNYLIAVSTNYVILYAVTALHGAASGTILVTSLALLADYVPVEKRGREIGMFDGVNLAGWGVGFFLGGIFKDVFHENLIWAFIISGSMAMIGCVFAYFNLNEPEAHKHILRKLTPGHILNVLKQRSILFLVLPWFIIYMLIGDIFAFFPKVSGQHFGLEGWVIGAAMAGACITIVVFQRGYGSLSDKVGRLKVMALGIGGIIALLIMLGAVLSTVNSLEAGTLRRSLEFDAPGDFKNGQFIIGNGTVMGDTIISLDPGCVEYSFGPVEFDNMEINWIEADWTGSNNTLILEWFEDGIRHKVNLSSGARIDLKDRPKNLTFIVNLGPGQEANLSDLRIHVQHETLAPDILGAIFGQPILVVGVVISGIMAGAFAPAALAGLADESHHRARGVTMAIYIVMISLGQVVGPLITGGLMDLYGNNGFLMFMVAAGICLLLVTFAKWMDKRLKDKAGATPSDGSKGLLKELEDGDGEE